MADFFANYESVSVARTAINSLADALKLAETDEAITAGAVTSIPVADITYNCAVSGDPIILIDASTGTAHSLTLAADVLAAATALTISSYTFASDIGTGSKIYYPGQYMANRIYDLYHPA